jgi:hypothetical protein
VEHLELRDRTQLGYIGKLGSPVGLGQECSPLCSWTCPSSHLGIAPGDEAAGRTGRRGPADELPGHLSERVPAEGEGLPPDEAAAAFLVSRAGVLERLRRFMSRSALEEVSDLAAVTVAVRQIRAIAG